MVFLEMRDEAVCLLQAAHLRLYICFATCAFIRRLLGWSGQTSTSRGWCSSLQCQIRQVAKLTGWAAIGPDSSPVCVYYSCIFYPSIFTSFPPKLILKYHTVFSTSSDRSHQLSTSLSGQRFNSKYAYVIHLSGNSPHFPINVCCH